MRSKNQLKCLIIIISVIFFMMINTSISATESKDTKTGITLSGWGDKDNHEHYNNDNEANISPEFKSNSAVYLIKSIYLYKKPTFYKKNRIEVYKKKPRTNRPMFIVNGYKYSKNGYLRYKVKDVNHQSETNNKTGYITARKDFVGNAYYQKKHVRMTVISPNGVNGYHKKNLSQKVTNYKQGTRVKVKKIVNYHLTKRFLLNNGQYISANRKLVQIGKVNYAKKIIAKRNINLYKDVDLQHKLKKVKKGSHMKISALYYSFANNYKIYGSKRY